MKKENIKIKKSYIYIKNHIFDINEIKNNIRKYSYKINNKDIKIFMNISKNENDIYLSIINDNISIIDNHHEIMNKDKISFEYNIFDNNNINLKLLYNLILLYLYDNKKDYIFKLDIEIIENKYNQDIFKNIKNLSDNRIDLYSNLLDENDKENEYTQIKDMKNQSEKRKKMIERKKDRIINLYMNREEKIYNHNMTKLYITDRYIDDISKNYR